MFDCDVTVFVFQTTGLNNSVLIAGWKIGNQGIVFV